MQLNTLAKTQMNSTMNDNLRNILDAKIIVLNDLYDNPEDLSTMDSWSSIQRLGVYEQLIQLQTMKEFKLELFEKGLI